MQSSVRSQDTSGAHYLLVSIFEYKLIQTHRLKLPYRLRKPLQYIWVPRLQSTQRIRFSCSRHPSVTKFLNIATGMTVNHSQVIPFKCNSVVIMMLVNIFYGTNLGSHPFCG